jgi:hypothetical protein
MLCMLSMQVAHNKEVMGRVLSRTPLLRAAEPIEIGLCQWLIKIA